MKTGMLHLHHYLPYIFSLVLLISIVRAYLGKIANPKKDKLLLLTLILAHIQLLVGFYLLFPFPEVEMSVIMKDSILRFKFIEHPSIMVLAVALITIAKIKSKKMVDVVKANKTIFSYFTVALVLIAMRFPWDKIF
ncbi:MAG: hypothetical protein HN677_05360 [Flavobacteriales bacterium]|jgi:tetrahydromethanopterin S-methyltransferase subunit E|nr:hypothetical protein [Flavobacteriales bacterium]